MSKQGPNNKLVYSSGNHITAGGERAFASWFELVKMLSKHYELEDNEYVDQVYTDDNRGITVIVKTKKRVK